MFWFFHSWNHPERRRASKSVKLQDVKHISLHNESKQMQKNITPWHLGKVTCNWKHLAQSCIFLFKTLFASVISNQTDTWALLWVTWFHQSGPVVYSHMGVDISSQSYFTVNGQIHCPRSVQRDLEEWSGGFKNHWLWFKQMPSFMGPNKLNLFNRLKRCTSGRF